MTPLTIGQYAMLGVKGRTRQDESCFETMRSISYEAARGEDSPGKYDYPRTDGRELWRYYHAQTGSKADASLYDIREHFQGLKPNGRMNTASSDAAYNDRIGILRASLKTLSAQIAEKVYEHGFLRK